MNRAPVALFALLCTLASSMVAAGVASDRPQMAAKPAALKIHQSELKTISYSASAQENWLTGPNWQAIDVERAVALPTKKIPTRIPEKVKPVAAIIITIEQAPAPAPKTVAKPAAKPVVPAKPNAAKPVVAAKPVAPKTVVAKPAVKTEHSVDAVMAVVTKLLAAAKTAPIQPRVSSSFSSVYVPTKEPRGVLSNNRISIADLHLWQPAIAITNGAVTALPVEEIKKTPENTTNDSNMVTLGDGKLQIAYGSLNMIRVGGSSFTPSPFIADNASSILVNRVGSSTPAVKTVKTQSRSSSFSVWTWTGVEFNRLQAGLIRTIDGLGRQFNSQINRAATIYIGRIQAYTSAQWFPVFGSGKPTIKSAQLKTSDKPSLTK